MPAEADNVNFIFTAKIKRPSTTISTAFSSQAEILVDRFITRHIRYYLESVFIFQALRDDLFDYVVSWCVSCDKRPG